MNECDRTRRNALATSGAERKNDVRLSGRYIRRGRVDFIVTSLGASPPVQPREKDVSCFT